MLLLIEKHISFLALKEELRKLGVNFITAGIVGIFIYHYVGTDPSSMFWACLIIVFLGNVALYFGVRKKEERK